ncbi:type II secretion system protein GspK [Cellvibrio mixtus]|uniref:type II secretion system protein GspK n=1 Tax=Cellvibrio mixtus TaxID=39650 RepID=UPI0005876406|nr:type II secretion system protein GspK [Cellvibrio mixtus]
MSVLWVLVIMVLAASAFAIWVERVREQAAFRQQQVEAYRRSTDMFARILYTYLTGPKTHEGVGWPGDKAESAQKFSFDSLDDFMAGAAPTIITGSAGFMAMDGSVLDAGDGLRIMVQDLGGLIGLSFLSEPGILNAIAKIDGRGLTGERFKDTLADYQDADDVREGLGAEAMDYHLQGLSPPLNGYLSSPLQLRSVLEWDWFLKNRDDSWILRIFRTEGGGGINANSAHADALALILDDPVKLQMLLAQRATAPFSSFTQLTKYIGDSEEVRLSVQPTAGFRFWWWHEGDTTARVYDVQFRPLESGTKAWYFNWTTRVNLPDDLATSTAKTIDHPFFR